MGFLPLDPLLLHCRQVRSFIALITRSGSALAMDGQCLDMTCFNVPMVMGRVSFLSSSSNRAKSLKILFILSWYTLTSLGFWGPVLGQLSSSLMTTGSSCEAMTDIICDILDTGLMECNTRC